jgi:hypothetical protein
MVSTGRRGSEGKWRGQRITGGEACRAGGRARARSEPLPQAVLARDLAGVDRVVEFPAYR